MRILLTGGTGFVGSYVARELASRGHETIVLRRQRSDLWRLEGVDNLTFEVAALEERDRIAQVLRVHQPDAIAHVGWAGVGNKDHNSPNNWRNVTMTMELLELAAENDVRHFVGLGSQAEYGLHGGIINEETPRRPVTMYGTAKVATFELATKASELFGVRFAWLRLFSSYGPRDNPGWFLPYLIRTLQQGERPKVTAGEQMWDYIHVQDAASAVVHACENPNMTGAYNLGGGSAERLRTTMERVQRLVPGDTAIGFGERPYAENQIMHLEADISRLMATGWAPKVQLEEGIKDLVDWMKAQ